MRDSSLSRALRTLRMLRPAPLSKFAPGELVEPGGFVHTTTLQKHKRPQMGPFVFPGGEGGIRTHGTVKPYTGFRIRRIRPLCHLSKIKRREGVTAHPAHMLVSSMRLALRAERSGPACAVQNRSRRFCRPLKPPLQNQAPRERGGPPGAYARLIHETRPPRKPTSGFGGAHDTCPSVRKQPLGQAIALSEDQWAGESIPAANRCCAHFDSIRFCRPIRSA
jgi:hypothetical protein